MGAYRCLCWSASLGCLSGTPFSPKISKSAQNRGYPLFGHFFRKFPPPFSGGLGGSGAQKVRHSPPAGHPPGEIAALFGPYCHLDPLKRGELPEKVPQKGYPPILGTFWRFRGFLGQNGVPDRPPREYKPAEKTVHHPRGSSQRSSRGSILHSLRA